MRTYIRVALRILRRERLYALLNIAGLALAIACCLVLALYVRSELTYDRHHVDHEQIYRVVNEFVTGGNSERLATTSPVLGEMLAETYAEVEDFTRFRPTGQRTLIRRDADAYYWDRVYFADPNVFRIFTHEIIYGDPETALVEPASIAVSETFARRYFGDANPIGETVTTDAGVPLNVTLVFADLPDNTHLKYDALLASTVDFLRSPDNTTLRRQALWNVGLYTYLVMPAGYDVRSFAALIDDFYEKNMAQLGRSIGTSWRAWLQPLADIHLGSDVGYDQPTGNPYYVYAFAAVALFILVVACINYVNLATARATKRARGVGVRKILGCDRGTLIAQFMGEAMLFAVIAGVAGVVLVEVVLTLSPLESLIGKDLSLDFVREPGLGLVILGGSLLIGALAGAYPAFYLSSWAPLTALVTDQRAGKGSALFRQGLVFAQFAISIAVIASTLLMASQMRFVADMPLGFATENRVMITLRGVDVLERLPTIKTELLRNPSVLGVTTAATMMGQPMTLTYAQAESNDGPMQQTLLTHMPIGDDFLEVMGIPLTEGRDFSKRLLTDVGQTFIVNRTFVRSMGWEEPLGKRIELGVGAVSGRVIGVVEDFHFKSLHSAIEPFAIYPLEERYDNVSPINRPFVSRLLIVNIAGHEIGRTLRWLQDKIAEFDPAHPFEFQFVDESLNALYASEQSLMKLIGIFAGICIFIACLGLFGLAAFTTEQRTKEIGVRKVLGASAAQIIWLLSRNVLALVMAGAVVASVAAYFAVGQWLQSFAYRAPLDPLVFVIATLGAAAVAVATIALQSFRTASEDPVDALRYE